MGLARAHPAEVRRQHHPAGSILEPTEEEEKVTPKEYIAEGA